MRAIFGGQEELIGYRYGAAFECASEDSIEDSWEKYLLSLDPKFRKKILYKQRKATRQGELRFTIVNSPQQLSKAVAALKLLHEKRWQAVGKSGVFASEKFLQFHNQLMQQCLSQGSLCMQVLKLDEQVIAVLYNVRLAGVNYYYQSGIDLMVGKNISAGVVAHCAAIRSSIELGDKFYDFMKGDAQSYKVDYSNAKTSMYHLQWFNRSVKGRFLWWESQLKLVLRKLKSMLRK